MSEGLRAFLFIYGLGYAFGLLPFLASVLLARRLKISRRARGCICALVAAATATPVFFSLGWVAAILPVSLGYWFSPQSLHWTVTQIIPATPWIHIASLLITTLLGFVFGWFPKPVSNSSKLNLLHGSA